MYNVIQVSDIGQSWPSCFLSSLISNTGKVSISPTFTVNGQRIHLRTMSCGSVIDFQDYGLVVQDTSKVNKETLKSLGKEIIDAFKTYGFCYLKNHGVDETLIKEYLQVSREFFLQSTELKAKYTISSDYRFGWLKLEGEKLNRERPVGDLHEVFKYSPLSDYAWPPLDKFEVLAKQIFKRSHDLAYRFLDVLSLGLNLPLDFLRNAHKLIGQSGNCSGIRTLYYPPVLRDANIKPGQVRLGEHTDYGTVVFNFQDNIGGLEARSPSGVFVPITPIDGTIVVHIGIMLQRWTSDALLGTVHRILIPEDEHRKNTERLSFGYFVQPDDDCVIKCIDGSDKYQPITSIEYVKAKYALSLYG